MAAFDLRTVRLLDAKVAQRRSRRACRLLEIGVYYGDSETREGARDDDEDVFREQGALITLVTDDHLETPLTADGFATDWAETQGVELARRGFMALCV